MPALILGLKVPESACNKRGGQGSDNSMVSQHYWWVSARDGWVNDSLNNWVVSWVKTKLSATYRIDIVLLKELWAYVPSVIYMIINLKNSVWRDGSLYSRGLIYFPLRHSQNFHRNFQVAWLLPPGLYVRAVISPGFFMFNGFCQRPCSFLPLAFVLPAHLTVREKSFWDYEFSAWPLTMFVHSRTLQLFTTLASAFVCFEGFLFSQKMQSQYVLLSPYDSVEMNGLSTYPLGRSQ